MPTTRPTNATVGPLSESAVDHRRRLIALRDRLTAELDVAPSAYVAALSRQLQAVLAELATMRDPEAGPSMLDQLRSRHDARRIAPTELSATPQSRASH